MRVSRRGQLGEGAGEEVDAAGTCRPGPVRRPHRGPASPQLRSVDQVVVDEARHVHQLDGDSRGERRVGFRRRREKDQQGAEPLAARGQRLCPDLGDEPRPRRDRLHNRIIQQLPSEQFRHTLGDFRSAGAVLPGDRDYRHLVLIRAAPLFFVLPAVDSCVGA